MSISQFLYLNYNSRSNYFPINFTHKLLIIDLKLIETLDFILLCFRFQQFFHPILPNLSRWLRVEGLLVNECAGIGRKKSKELRRAIRLPQ
ncbi:hypothetical protein ACHQM5_030269 [Ranunculus cassubicifolius]